MFKALKNHLSCFVYHKNFHFFTMVLIFINLVKMLVIYSIGSKIIFFYAIIIAITTGFFSPIFTLYSACLFTQAEGEENFAEKWQRADEMQ